MDLIIVVADGHGKCCLDIAREVYDDIVFFGMMVLVEKNN